MIEEEVASVWVVEAELNRCPLSTKVLRTAEHRLASAFRIPNYVTN